MKKPLLFLLCLLCLGAANDPSIMPVVDNPVVQSPRGASQNALVIQVSLAPIPSFVISENPPGELLGLLGSPDCVNWTNLGPFITQTNLGIQTGWQLFKGVQEVQLAWNPSPDTNVVGYDIYEGNQMVASTPSTNAFVWVGGGQESFYVTAFDINLLQSPPSNTVMATNTATPPTLQISTE